MPIPPFFLLGSGANVTISALLKYALSFSLSSMFVKQNGATLATSRDRSPGRDRSNPSEWDIRQASVATEPPLPQYGHHSESFVSDRPTVKLITPLRSLRGRRDGVSKLSDGVGIPEVPVENVQSKTVPLAKNRASTPFVFLRHIPIHKYGWITTCIAMSVVLYMMQPPGGGGRGPLPPSWGPELEHSYSFRAFVTDITHWLIGDDRPPHQQASSIIQRLTGAARE
jgi:hypothetical protein